MITENFKNNFCEITRNEDASILLFRWFDTTQSMDEQGFKDSLLKYVELLKASEFTKVLVNVSELLFPIVPELQTWVDENINYPTVQMGLKHMAIVVSPNMIEQMSVEQTLEEQAAQAIQIKYFGTAAEAIDWLKTTN
jgi:hypothetical protein